MIAYLTGTIHKRLPDSIILLAQGVGYQVFMPQNTLLELNENDQVETYIHTAVKEDYIKLMGFLSLEKLDLFKLLISVSGVGPKSGLEILNNPADAIRFTISNEDTSLLVSTPGIGKKTAERIIIDLKGKIAKTANPGNINIQSDFDEEVVIALTKLGYQRQSIKRLLKNKPDDIEGAENIIKYFLQNV